MEARDVGGRHVVVEADQVVERHVSWPTAFHATRVA
jgi:hypothetical protein